MLACMLEKSCRNLRWHTPPDVTLGSVLPLSNGEIGKTQNFELKKEYIGTLHMNPLHMKGAVLWTFASLGTPIAFSPLFGKRQHYIWSQKEGTYEPRPKLHMNLPENAPGGVWTSFRRAPPCLTIWLRRSLSGEGAESNLAGSGWSRLATLPSSFVWGIKLARVKLWTLQMYREST